MTIESEIPPQDDHLQVGQEQGGQPPVWKVQLERDFQTPQTPQPELAQPPQQQRKPRRDLSRLVYHMLQDGRSGEDIMYELSISPSRLKWILQRSQRLELLRKVNDISADLSTRLLIMKKALPLVNNLCGMAEENSESGRKACVDMLNQLNLNYPPAAKTMPRASFWD